MKPHVPNSFIVTTHARVLRTAASESSYVTVGFKLVPNLQKLGRTDSDAVASGKQCTLAMLLAFFAMKNDWSPLAATPTPIPVS